MSKAGLYRLLIVEDETNWGQLLYATARESGQFASVQWVKTRREAHERLSSQHFHFVSIDQRIPDAPRELPLDDNGLRLCREIVESNQFTNRGIYTVNGAKRFANQIGLLDATEYIEKRAQEPLEDLQFETMDVVPYIRKIADDLNNHYLRWSMVRAGRYLPRAIGGSAEQFGQRWESSDWSGAITNLNDTWERALELAWAQTAALARHVEQPLPPPPPGTDPFTPAAKEADMAALWPALDTAEVMAPWWKFLSAETGAKDKTNAVRQALRILRSLRNATARGRLPEPVPRDLADRMESILILIDLLAGWAEMPMIEGIRHHPQRRNVIQFNILAGAPPWQMGETAAVFGDLPSEQNVFLRWKKAETPFLLDLYPFILRERIGLRHEPHVFCTARYDRDHKLSAVTYRSLVSGDTVEFSAPAQTTLFSKLAPLLKPT